MRTVFSVFYTFDLSSCFPCCMYPLILLYCPRCIRTTSPPPTLPTERSPLLPFLILVMPDLNATCWDGCDGFESTVLTVTPLSFGSRDHSFPLTIMSTLVVRRGSSMPPFPPAKETVREVAFNAKYTWSSETSRPRGLKSKFLEPRRPLTKKFCPGRTRSRQSTGSLQKFSLSSQISGVLANHANG